MDEDLDQMSREQLLDEVKKLRHAIRTHRDSSGHARAPRTREEPPGSPIDS